MPIASNRTSAGREINRRVEFVVLEEAASVPPVTPAPQPTAPAPVVSPPPTPAAAQVVSPPPQTEPARAPAVATGPIEQTDPIFYLYRIPKARSLKDLSRSLWRTSAHAPLLLTHNPAAERIDKTLDPGTVVKIPRTTTYTVKKGDTLGSIAKKVLGDGKTYTVIAEASRGVLPTSPSSRWE